MRRGRKKSTSFSLKKKMQKTITVLVSGTILFLSLSLFGLYLFAQTSSARAYSMAHLRQVSGSADILFDQVTSIQNSIYGDAAVYGTMVTTSVDRLEETRTAQKLRALTSAYPYVRFIGVYNPVLRRYTTNAGVFSEESFSADSFFAALGEQSETSFPAMVGSTYPTSPTQSAVYTFLRRPNPYSKVSGDALIVVDVDQSYLQSLIGSFLTDEKERQIVVTDKSGRIISATEDVFEFAAADRARLADTAAGQEALSGNQFVWIGRSPCLFTYVRSPHTGWTFVALQPLHSVLDGVLLLGSGTALLAVLLLLLCTTLSRRFSRQLHEPIRALVEQYASEQMGDEANVNEVGILREAFYSTENRMQILQNTVDHSASATKRTCLGALLEGNNRQVIKSKALFEQAGIDLAAKAYLPVLVECTRREGDDWPLLACALENIATELLSHLCPCEFLPIAENRCALLLFLDGGEAPGDLPHLLRLLADIIGREFRAEITFCIGRTAARWEDIGDSFERTLLAASERPAIPADSILWAEELLAIPAAREYPPKLQNRLAEGVLALDREKTDAAAEEILAYFGGVSWSYARSYCKHIMLSLLTRFEHLVIRDNEALGAGMEFIELVDRSRDAPEIAGLLRQYAELLIGLLEAERKGSADKALEDVLAHIGEHYSDPDISLYALADSVNLSPAYLGKLFAKATAMPFTDYLNGIRLERAAELLAGTSDSVKVISERVGLLNTNYFFTIFKKKYGMTPASYRKFAVKGNVS